MYATTTAIATAMIGVTFDSLTTALASQKIEDAESEVNKYLSKRYNIASATFQTTTSIPPMVRTITQRLAEAYVWRSIGRGSKESRSRAKDIVDEVMPNLKDIAEYKVDLLDTAGSIIVEASGGTNRIQSSTSTYTDTFGEDDDLNWAIDSDKLEDISNSRD